MKSSSARAFTLLELMVVVALVSVLALVLLSLCQPNLKARVPRLQCVNNLKQVGLAFRIWRQDYGDYPMHCTNGFDGPAYANQMQMFRYFQALSNVLTSPKLVMCPADERRAATNFSTGFGSTNIGFFAGLDADESRPNDFLAGDRNLQNGQQPQNGVLDFLPGQPVKWGRDMHREQGNVLFTDGRVEQFTSKKVRIALVNTGLATNRLVFP
jgi:prepilin-type N-terminal cleavage/methylation domain-containing protein/prepilin-type processing-associated H-X9-DG protein